jgi:RNase P/RNase MRP subunit p29
MLDWKNTEYLGHNIRVINSTDNSKKNISGCVIYQTKEYLIIRTKENKLKKIKLSEIINLKK